jgi:tetrahydromethanopterin S-methyltransferase subunit G
MSNDELLDENQQSKSDIGGTDLRIRSRQKRLDEIKEKLKKTKTFLYVLAGLFAIITVIEAVDVANQGPYIFWIVVGLDIFMVASFLVSAIMFDKNPFAWTLFATILYAALQLTIILADPSTAYQGVLIKAIIIIFLVRGINRAREKSAVESEIEMLELEELREE